MAEPKPGENKKIALKLTGEKCGMLITPQGTFYADSALPRGQKHTAIVEGAAKEALKKYADRGLTVEKEGAK